KRTIKFGGELKIRIHFRHSPAPDLRQLRLDRSIKGGIDLHHVKEAGQVVRVEDAHPVFISPARSPNGNHSRHTVAHDPAKSFQISTQSRGNGFARASYCLVIQITSRCDSSHSPWVAETRTFISRTGVIRPHD